MLRKMLIVLSAGLFILGISKLSLAMMCGEHSGNQQLAQAHSEHEHGAAESTKQAASEEAINVDNKICPVSGEKIDEATKATYEYQGKIYNFCCAACIDEFKKDPEKYIKKIEEEKQTEETSPEYSTEHEGHHEHRH